MPFEKKAGKKEYQAYDLFLRAGVPVPRVLGYDEKSSALTLEDLRETHVSGDAARERVPEALEALADLHASFWDNERAFGQIGLHWRLESQENFARHLKGMEKGIKPYCKAHKMNGAIFRQALAYVRAEMPKLLETRFHAGKNITILHGDLHPGNMMFPTGAEGTVKFIDLEAVRVGLAAEDLAMLLASSPPAGSRRCRCSSATIKGCACGFRNPLWNTLLKPCSRITASRWLKTCSSRRCCI